MDQLCKAYFTLQLGSMASPDASGRKPKEKLEVDLWGSGAGAIEDHAVMPWHPGHSQWGALATHSQLDFSLQYS